MTGTNGNGKIEQTGVPSVEVLENGERDLRGVAMAELAMAREISYEDLEKMSQQELICYLQDRFLESAEVTDIEKGYIKVEAFNIEIIPEIRYALALLWKHHFEGVEIDAIIGLPDAGMRLSGMVSHVFRKPELPAKRRALPPGSWGGAVAYGNESFTSGETAVDSYIGRIEKGRKYLLVDDVVAWGKTGRAAVEAIEAAGGIVVGLAAIFDKDFQGGRRELEEIGVDVCTAITVAKLTMNQTTQKGEIILT